MRRLARWTLNALTALSLLLCVAAVGLWVASYFVGQQLYVPRLDDQSGKAFWTADPAYWHEDTLRVGDGGIGFFHLVRSAEPLRAFPKEQWRTAFGQTPFYESGPPGYPRFSVLSTDTRSWGGFECGSLSHSSLEGGTRGWLVVLPLWSLAVVSALLPTLRGMYWMRLRRRRRAGKCPGCGYDLRATPGRCPECGRAAAADAPAARAV